LIKNIRKIYYSNKKIEEKIIKKSKISGKYSTQVTKNDVKIIKIGKKSQANIAVMSQKKKYHRTKK